MALYLGAEKMKINLDGISYSCNIYSSIPLNKNVLLSLDNYILQSLDANYLISNTEDSVPNIISN